MLFRTRRTRVHRLGVQKRAKLEKRYVFGHIDKWEGHDGQIKVGVNPSLKKEMWLLMHLITKKTCPKMYKSIHFWNQKKQMNPMVATDFCKIMRFSRNSSVTMVTIEFFLESITKIWFY